MRLRNYFIIGAICAFLLIAWSIASAAPSINFKDVANWETLQVIGPNAAGNVFELKRNPDSNHIVRYILVRRWRTLDWAITGYAYYEGEKLFVYQLDRPYSEGRFIPRTAPLAPEELNNIYTLLHPEKGV